LGVKKLLIRVISAIQTAFFPPRCLVCGSFFQPNHHAGIQQTYKNLQHPLQGLQFQTADGGQTQPIDDDFFETCFKILFNPILCSLCLDGFEPLESPFCIKCGFMFAGRQDDDHFCGDCLTGTKRFSRARAAGVYNRTLMAVIHRYKYRAKIQLALPLGALLLTTLMRYWDWIRIDTVIPVPLHISRLRKRGFNQAFLLVRDWNRIVKELKVGLPDILIERDLLIRNRRTDSQTGLARNLRMANIKNAFRVRDPSKVEDKRVLVVDDVYTTGATADACAAELLRNGARTVDVLTLARAM
jgi:ComF family protein